MDVEVAKGGCSRHDSWKHKSGNFGKTDFYYVGMTSDWARRFWEHCVGFEYEPGKTPYLHQFRLRELDLIYVEKVDGTYEDALKREKEIKGYSSKKKEAMTDGDYDCKYPNILIWPSAITQSKILRYFPRDREGAINTIRMAGEDFDHPPFPWSKK